MKKIKLIPLLIFIASLSSCTGSKTKWSNRAVVKLDQIELTAEEFSRRLAIKLKSFDALTAKDSSVFSRLKEEVVDEFIMESLALKWSQEKGLQLKNSQIKDELVKIKQAYPDDLSFKMALATEGLTYETWLKKLRTSLLQKSVFEIVTEQVDKPSMEEIKNYYNSHPNEFRQKDLAKIRQIVLKTENNANRIIKELKAGKSFGELAKNYSITPEAKQEGLLGWMEKGTSKVFDEALNQGVGLKLNLYKSNFGFHIIQILDIKKGKKLSLKEAESKIVYILTQQNKQKLFAQWLEAELRKAHVYKDEKLLQSIYAETQG
ncbi:MAG: peptidylprolyl isomerase [Bdellovibrionales bacterium]|nr:peptidylprolyl isomerase [Bdellovibrionales bacterium]